MSTSALPDLGTTIRPIPRAALLVSVLTAASFAAAGCQPAAQQDGDVGQAEAGPSTREVIQMERGLWEALSEGDHQGFAQEIADDATMVGGDGLVSKQDMMGMLEGSTLESYELGNFQVMQPGSGVAVVTYRYSETFRPADADSAMSFGGWATSIWENRDGTWTAVFHQTSEARSEE